jgi:methylenetetrahydrofolate dehydrogenase (NADP+)/methenyltetrahydrofolate cyclohydrolase
MPLPAQIDSQAVLEAIRPDKDVDGFHPVNGGYLLSGHPRLAPCTPSGIIKMLDYYGYDLKGKNAVVIGRSNIVGKPMALLMLQRHASVSILHSRTADLGLYTREADVIVVAVGVRNVLTGEMVKPGAVVIDVGMNRLEGKKVVGDVDFESVAPKCSLITPVPGGVGPMTIATLIDQTVQAAEKSAQQGADPVISDLALKSMLPTTPLWEGSARKVLSEARVRDRFQRLATGVRTRQPELAERRRV